MKEPVGSLEHSIAQPKGNPLKVKNLSSRIALRPDLISRNVKCPQKDYLQADEAHSAKMRASKIDPRSLNDSTGKGLAQSRTAHERFEVPREPSSDITEELDQDLQQIRNWKKKLVKVKSNVSKMEYLNGITQKNDPKLPLGQIIGNPEELLKYEHHVADKIYFPRGVLHHFSLKPGQISLHRTLRGTVISGLSSKRSIGSKVECWRGNNKKTSETVDSIEDRITLDRSQEQGIVRYQSSESSSRQDSQHSDTVGTPLKGHPSNPIGQPKKPHFFANKTLALARYRPEADNMKDYVLGRSVGGGARIDPQAKFPFNTEATARFLNKHPHYVDSNENSSTKHTI